ncbi:hypothetical protein N825_27355 [Skermanella stibiiresistens SB22]|uniref:Squalene cyclase C-terminal domain-containing protein n=1 Tax=Skermanella stibiiresistens SB22 TaxID=1385369 RepID=W9H9C5_9PROT|nr:hypothetical protein N825_27355 [Skermanella stibiiresistens SB22]
MTASLDWLREAQDKSASRDGGVARHFSLLEGWAASYPETTGYIVPTLIAQARLRGDDDLRQRARRMLDWLVSIQFSEGGFQGGVIGQTPRVPVTFNTGQILIGLAAGVAEFGDAYRPAMTKAADWLASSLDEDGCWRRFPTPFAKADDKSYETHVAWGLLEAARLDPARGWGEAALRQVRWAISRQRPNGWMADCCLEEPSRPLTHTLGYALRGILEASRFAPEQGEFRSAGVRLADGLLGCVGSDGALPGRLTAEWKPAVDWVCLTGAVQVAHCWLMLYQDTGRADYKDAALRVNSHVRRTVDPAGPPETRGGVKGSFPVDGDYGTFEYLNWAAKFFIDASQLEREVMGRT